MASRKTKKPKKRAQRATSNVFAMFGQDQIQVRALSEIFVWDRPLYFLLGIQRGLQYD